MAYIDLIRKYGVSPDNINLGPLSREEEKEFSDPRLEEEWQQYLQDCGGLKEDQLTKYGFMNLGLGFAFRLRFKGKEKWVAVCQR